MAYDISEEQDEYNYVRSLNKSLNIQSPHEYVAVKAKHENYIPDAEQYFKAKGVWDNWYDFLGVDTTKFIQTKQKWIDFCKEKNIKSYDEYTKLCDIYDCLPRVPEYLYIGCRNVAYELDLYDEII